MTDHNLAEQAEREITKDLGGRARMLDGELAVMGANYQLICDMYKLAVRDRCSLLKLKKELEESEKQRDRFKNLYADAQDEIKDTKRGGMSWEDACGSNPEHEF